MTAMSVVADQPLFYTTNEGGVWYPWIHGIVTVEDLEKRNPKFAGICNQPVHSFAFSDPQIDKYKRWDCINGWTQR